MCGEKTSGDRELDKRCGSPPRVRGEGDISQAMPAYLRITPACAGRSSRARRPHEGFRDHPRVCGEKRSLNLEEKLKIGSPPRVRGEEVETENGGIVRRITPACAGRRNSRLLDRVNFRDHPRVCGEKAAVQLGSNQQEGSPPRVRGEGRSTSIV